MVTSIQRSAIALGAALTLVAAVLFFTHAGGVSPAPETALAVHPILTPDICLGCTMSLEVQGTLGASAVTCDSKTGSVQNPAKCTLEEGSSFAVKIVANSIPPVGYTAWQTYLAYGGLLYKPTTDIADEIAWPDGSLPLRASDAGCSGSCLPSGTEGHLQHGDVTSVLPPVPISAHAGPLVELQMNCQTAGVQRLALLPFFQLSPLFAVDGNRNFPNSPFFLGPDGAAYVFHDGNFSRTIPVAGAGSLPLDLNNDGQLDLEQILKPTSTPTATATPNPPNPTATIVLPVPTATPAFNDGELLDYPVHTLINVNCVEAPAPPVGGVGLPVDLDALPLDSSNVSSGNWPPPAALAAVTLAALVGAAWYARNRRLRA